MFDITQFSLKDMTAKPTQEPATQPNIGVFDPALSKIGFLVPGQVGVTGE